MKGNKRCKYCHNVLEYCRCSEAKGELSLSRKDRIQKNKWVS